MIGRGTTVPNKINPTESTNKPRKINHLRILAHNTDGGFRDPRISRINNC
jgi:hypothetical protein